MIKGLYNITKLISSRFSSVTNKYDLLKAVEDGINEVMEEDEAMVLMAHILDEFIDIDYDKRKPLIKETKWKR